MRRTVPHPIPYQGSKRSLATIICSRFPQQVETLFEPFAGSAAISLYAAQHGLARRFVIGDILPELIALWRAIVTQPEQTAERYEALWRGQINGGPEYFNSVRERFNTDREPVALLYLVARCVKNAVRFNRHGRFTQSADKRRLGVQPARMALDIAGASHLLRGRVEFIYGDFTRTVAGAGRHDLIYMDPPYQGTTYGRDKRYFAQLERAALMAGLSDLNQRAVPYLLSYDGMTGETVHGEPLPDELGLRRLLLPAGRSTQATLHGRDAMTVESLYLSRPLAAGLASAERQQQAPI